MELVSTFTAIIQARCGSSRFPSKILEPFDSFTLLDQVITNVLSSEFVGDVILATTQDPQDQLLEMYANKYSIGFYAGSTDDVLSRFYYASINSNAENIVRITADDPFKPAWLIDELASEFLHREVDYISNNNPPSYPEGFDLEIFKFHSLSTAFQQARKPSEREHVTPFMKSHPKLKIHYVQCPHNFSWARLTVDYQEDLDRMRQINSHFRSQIYSSKEAFYQLRHQPLFVKYATSAVPRNEGYNKSLLTDPG